MPHSGSASGSRSGGGRSGSGGWRMSSPMNTLPRTSYTGPLMPRASENVVKAPLSTAVPVTATTAAAAAPTFGQMIKEGFSFGLGSSIARNMVDRLFSKPPVAQQQQQPPAAAATTTTDPKTIAYEKCLQQENGTHETCKEHLEHLG